jgi:hypothetical protein
MTSPDDLILVLREAAKLAYERNGGSGSMESKGTEACLVAVCYQ